MRFRVGKMLHLIGALGLTAVMTCTPLQAALTGYYEDINITYNGSQKNLSGKPISVNGVTYLPVRAMCNLLGLQINWNVNTNTMNITGSTSTGSALSTQTEIAAKDAEIAALKKELAKYQGTTSVVVNSNSSTTSTSSSTTDDYDQTSGKDITSKELTATEKKLSKAYDDYFDNIDFDFDLELKSSKLKLVISYDSSSENTKYNKLSTSKIKNFLEEVCETVRDRHDDIVIEGSIKYRISVKCTFTYSKNDKFSYSTSTRDDDNDVDDDIKDIVKRVTSIGISDYGKEIDISRYNVSVDDDDELVTFKLYIDITEDIKTAWNQNTGTDKDTTLKSDLKAIAKKIVAEDDDYDVEGYVYDASGDKIARYLYDDNELYKYTIN